MPVQRDPGKNALLSLASWIDEGGEAAPTPHMPPAAKRAGQAPSLADLLRRRGKAEAARTELQAEIDAVRERLREFAATVDQLRAARRGG